MTLFGKTRLNENCVEPLFHFNTFWNVRMHYRSFIMHFKTLTKFLNENENALKIILNSFSIIHNAFQRSSIAMINNPTEHKNLGNVGVINIYNVYSLSSKCSENKNTIELQKFDILQLLSYPRKPLMTDMQSFKPLKRTNSCSPSFLRHCSHLCKMFIKFLLIKIYHSLLSN